MGDERTQRLAAAIANLRAAGESIPENSLDWTRAPGPYEGITRQMIVDLSAEVKTLRDQNTWLLRIVSTAIIAAAIAAIARGIF